MQQRTDLPVLTAEGNTKPVVQLIAIVGAESTGKTVLAQALARHFHAAWVPEYLRAFTEKAQRTPAQQEQLGIMQAQAHLENQAQADAEQNHQCLVFCDASTLMTAIYSAFVFGDPTLYQQAAKLHQRYALTLLLNNEVEWQGNGIQRDGPQVREPIFALLQQWLTAMHVPYSVVKGVHQERLNNAIAQVDSLLLDAL